MRHGMDPLAALVQFSSSPLVLGFFLAHDPAAEALETIQTSPVSA